jgi:hypothetical protein
LLHDVFLVATLASIAGLMPRCSWSTFRCASNRQLNLSPSWWGYLSRRCRLNHGAEAQPNRNARRLQASL